MKLPMGSKNSALKSKTSGIFSPVNPIFLLKSHLSRLGGAEKYTFRLGSALKKNGYDVILLTTGTLPPSSDFYIHTTQNKALSFQNVRAFDQFCRQHTKTAPRVFSLDRTCHQTHLRASNGVHAAYLERRNASTLKKWSFALNPLHRTLLAFEKKAFESPDLQCLITNSHMVKNEILAHYQVNPTKIRVVHNGVEWKEMESPFSNWQTNRPSLLNKYQLSSHVFHFLFVGHNYTRKGLIPLLHAFKNLPSDAHLSVVGQDKDLSFFKKLLVSLKIENRVHLFGPQKNTSEFYQLADALVIPSFYDPFANVTVEALAMGLTVVTSKTNGGHEILSSENGVVIDTLEHADAIEAALRLALQRPKTAQRATLIRNSVSHLDFDHQLTTLIQTAGL